MTICRENPSVINIGQKCRENVDLNTFVVDGDIESPTWTEMVSGC
jgi:hypothetical protein